ncbi:MAG: bifunctional phosphoribosylaminoimidazolecarboxamide formyltransferase/IMP cyclohydrolase [Planctomycetes bacterium]|nr:bifunctional phosphoribosylaminoimidazolecarboxamide formyltransferase/IMP cyclohydrolase [Planctomycetota bacterium]
MNDGLAIRRALLSVADKHELLPLARALSAKGVALVSTGGTAAALRADGLEVQDVSAVTEHPEILGGRVKTLHPRIHGGILARLPEDQGTLDELGIEPFDLVVVNLYRFEDAAAKGAPLDELIEEVDIGGPCLLRAAAKNHTRVVVLPGPEHYPAFLGEWLETGSVSLASRRRFALAAFARTQAYDQAIVATLGAAFGEAAPAALPERLALSAGPATRLRYGENPHQAAAFYPSSTDGLGGLRVLEGSNALSYTNLLDVDAALGLCAALKSPGVCVIKHAGPCGAACDPDPARALEAAWAGDPVSAFGSFVGVNVPVDLALAEALVERPFVEGVVAPGFSPEAEARIRARKGWGKTARLIEARPAPSAPVVRSVAGGVLVQDEDRIAPTSWEVVSERAPTPDEDAALRFAWACVRHVRSNAIVLAKGRAIVGVGGGQPSRVDAVQLAAKKAGERAQGAALASDAFFPFPDGVEVAHAAGVTAVVQPGGSKKDAKVIARANELGVAMVFTGTRVFRH